MKKFHKIMLAAVVMGTMVFSFGCSSQEQSAESGTENTTSSTETTTEEETTAEDTQAETETAGGDYLVMATNAEFEPYEYREGGEIVGIDVEIAQAIAEDMGKELQIEDMAFDSIIAAVQTGKADMGVAGMTVTEDRLVNVDFSDTYVTAGQVIIVPKEGSTVTSPADLEGKIIGVQLGTTGDLYVTDEVPNTTVERYNKGFEAVQALKQGKIDAVVIDNQPASKFVEQNDDLMILDEFLTSEEYAIAVAKGNTELLDQINATIAEMKENGELQAILDKYIPAE